MKKSVHILSFIFSFLIVFSCEPSRAENGDLLNGIKELEIENGEGTTSSRLLVKMISHSKDEDTGEWVDETFNYKYANRKLISYEGDFTEKTNFEYNTNNKISKIVATGQTSSLEYLGGNVSKISTDIAGVAKINATYIYTSGKLSRVISIQEYTLPVPTKLYLETTYEYNGENMVKSNIKNGIYLPNGTLEMNPMEDQELIFTYDNKKSPYKLLPKEFIIWLAGIGPQGAAYLSTNNVKTYSIKVGGNSEPALTYNHEYDTEDYLIKSSNNAGETIKYEYLK